MSARQIWKDFKSKNKPFQFKESYNSVIPLNIFQTWRTKKLPPYMLKCAKNVKNMNPQFKYHLFDNKDCYYFIKANFPEEVANAYISLIPGAYKADLWRYCVLYKLGGIYLDIKYKCINNFNFMALTEQEYFVKDFDGSGSGTYNALIVAKPGNSILLNCINDIVEHVRIKYYGGSLSITGPLLLGKYSTKEEKDSWPLTVGASEIKNVMHALYFVYNGTIILGFKYDEYYKELNKQPNYTRYDNLFKNKQVYK
jgi:mannosyltransferase OCH1-like enzyme